MQSDNDIIDERPVSLRSVRRAQDPARPTEQETQYKAERDDLLRRHWVGQKRVFSDWR